MKNLFIGGSSELAIQIAENISNTYNLSRKKNKFYRKNFIVKNYSRYELKKVFKKLVKFKFNNILIFNGYFMPSTLSGVKEDDLNKMLNINLKTPLIISKLCLENKIIENNGSVYFISSLAAKKPAIGNALYAITKNSLNFANKIFHLEQKKRNIRFNIISFGIIRNKMGKYLIDSIPMLRNNKKNFSKLNIIKNKIKKILQSKKFNGKNIYI
jgi:NAD(P)-dependent dehydrogenase (short-subunit alcohol dehydrogenase family)